MLGSQLFLVGKINYLSLTMKNPPYSEELDGLPPAALDLIALMETMTPEEQAEVLRYAEFLHTKMQKKEDSR